MACCARSASAASTTEARTASRSGSALATVASWRRDHAATWFQSKPSGRKTGRVPVRPQVVGVPLVARRQVQLGGRPQAVVVDVGVVVGAGPGVREDVRVGREQHGVLLGGVVRVACRGAQERREGLVVRREQPGALGRDGREVERRRGRRPVQVARLRVVGGQHRQRHPPLVGHLVVHQPRVPLPRRDAHAQHPRPAPSAPRRARRARRCPARARAASRRRARPRSPCAARARTGRAAARRRCRR